MSFMFLAKDYWPQPTVNCSIMQEFTTNYDGKKLYSIFSLDPNDWSKVYQDDYVEDKWVARWLMKYDTPNGVIEYGDQYPATDWRKIWGPKRSTIFEKGKEIVWGNIQQVGDEVSAPIKIDMFNSTFFTGPSEGYQWVKFVSRKDKYTVADGSATYDDVIEIEYDQQWGKDIHGARQWMARDIGIIQLKWRNDRKDVPGQYMPLIAKNTKINPVKR